VLRITMNLKTVLSFILFCAALAACSPADPPTQSETEQLTAEQAKDALIRFIRAHRKTFIGDRDPDRLAQLPLKPLPKGSYSFGAFQLDIPNRAYSVAIGVDGPAPYFYNGTFTEQDGFWTASEPKVQHVHRLPDNPK
jgi:hypothetical protein